MTEIAIYHPFIELADARLLRTCVLYWDEIRTIVPESMRAPYDSPVSKEAFDAGVLRPRFVSPDSPEVIQTGEEFLADAENSAIQTSAKNAVKNLRLHRDKLPRLHPGKLSEKVRQALFSTEAEDADGFLRVTDGFGNAYMSRLASVIGEADGAIPLTDDESSQAVVVDRYVEELDSPSIREAESTLARLSIQAIQIHPDTPVRNVVRFRDKHRDELERFRRAIRKLARETVAVRDRAQFEQELRRIVSEEIQPSLQELTAKIREHHIGFGWFVLGMAFPYMAKTAVEYAGGCIEGLDVIRILAEADVGKIAAGGVGVGVRLFIAACVTRRGVRGAQHDDPYGYLLSAQRDLSGA